MKSVWRGKTAPHTILERLSAAGRGVSIRAATGTGGSTEVDAAVQFETADQIIHFNGLCFLEKIFVYDELELIDLELLIRLARLIQSHGQGRPASATFIEKYANGRNLSAFEVLGNHLGCRRCNVDHVVLLANKNMACSEQASN